MSTPELSIIIVSWNTKDLTLEAIRSCIAETQETNYELIVVDNDSPDGSAEAIGAAFPDLDLFLAEKDNHGFAKGNNIAAKHARGDYILLLNPDTVTLDGAIDKLMAFARRTPDAKIWGGRTLNPDQKTLNPTSIWKHMTLWSLFCQALGLTTAFARIPGLSPEAYAVSEFAEERPVDIPSGCFFLIKRDLWETLEGFDLSYVMYGEEADLCRRALAHGAAPMYTPDATIVHYLGAATTIRANRTVSLFRAKVTMLRRYFNPFSKALGLAFFWITPLSRAAIYGTLGTIFRKAHWRENAASWIEVFRRRSEWMPGYPKLER